LPAGVGAELGAPKIDTSSKIKNGESGIAMHAKTTKIS
jgi:hypothetical protein